MRDASGSLLQFGENNSRPYGRGLFYVHPHSGRQVPCCVDVLFTLSLINSSLITWGSDQLYGWG